MRRSVALAMVALMVSILWVVLLRDDEPQVPTLDEAKQGHPRDAATVLAAADTEREVAPRDTPGAMATAPTPTGNVPHALELVRSDALQPGQRTRFETGAHDGNDFLFRATPGRHRIRLQPDPDPMLRSACFPVERDVELRASAETLVTANVSRGGRVQLTVHLPDDRKVEVLDGLVPSVDGPSGQAAIPLAGYQVSPRPGDWENRPFGPAGTPFVCLHLLPPGRHELTITANGYQTQRIGVSITAGEITPVDVWLQR